MKENKYRLGQTSEENGIMSFHSSRVISQQIKNKIQERER